MFDPKQLEVLGDALVMRARRASIEVSKELEDKLTSIIHESTLSVEDRLAKVEAITADLQLARLQAEAAYAKAQADRAAELYAQTSERLNKVATDIEVNTSQWQAAIDDIASTKTQVDNTIAKLYSDVDDCITSTITQSVQTLKQEQEEFTKEYENLWVERQSKAKAAAHATAARLESRLQKKVDDFLADAASQLLSERRKSAASRAWITKQEEERERKVEEVLRKLDGKE